MTFLKNPLSGHIIFANMMIYLSSVSLPLSHIHLSLSLVKKAAFNGRVPSQELHKCNVHRQLKQSRLTLECAACKSSAVYSLCLSAKEKTGFDSPVMIRHPTRCGFVSPTHLNVSIELWLATYDTLAACHNF